ncbi:MAG: hypothetical protein L3J59_08525 [Methylococcaceae bacterium]|nr:hypothetical protein [Methylococcaceae bacterium]
MNTLMKMTIVWSTIMVFSSNLALAADSDNPLKRDKVQTQKQVYGIQLMTEQERIENRSKMRAAKTAEERELIRSENHNRMKERAKQQGVTLTDEPPIRGGGKGFRKNMNSKGMGVGRGRP